MLTNEGVESHVEAAKLLGLQHRLFPGVGHPPCTRRRQGKERNIPQHSPGVRWLDPLLGVGDDRQIRVSTTPAMAATERIADAVDPPGMPPSTQITAEPFGTNRRSTDVGDAEVDA
jgi:hypothetical protein